MGIFGWSYPPGDEPEPPCPLCGESVDNCKCPECSECGEVGCLKHLKDSDLICLGEKISYQKAWIDKEIHKRDQKIVCNNCNHSTTFGLYYRVDAPFFVCEKCKKEMDGNGNIII